MAPMMIDFENLVKVKKAESEVLLNGSNSNSLRMGAIIPVSELGQADNV